MESDKKSLKECRVKSGQRKDPSDSRLTDASCDVYRTARMQKEMVLKLLKEKGCRITWQRKILLDIILEEECASCKEIYYKAAAKDSSIGIATVYRMINVLEEIGAISRKNMYRITCEEKICPGSDCVICSDGQTTCRLTEGEWNRVIREGLRCCGYLNQRMEASLAGSV